MYRCVVKTVCETGQTVEGFSENGFRVREFVGTMQQEAMLSTKSETVTWRTNSAITVEEFKA